MSINYTTYSSQLSNLMVQSQTDPNFTTFLPGCIDYAEQRIYRELDLQVTRTFDATTTLSSGDRTWTLPILTTGTPVVVEQLNLFTPAGTTSSNCTKVPLTAVTKEFLDFAWPSNLSSWTGQPIYFAPVNNVEYIFGPSPDQSYTLEFVGTMRPTPLSASNSSTFLTQSLPDLFIAASMVFATAYQRDFGAQVDDPQRAASWESQYKILKESANIEELRKRFMGAGWQAMTPAPTATPARV
jgi:hypothetical protein